MITFRCTGCKQLLKTPPTAAGKQVKCTQCGALLRVPEPAAVAAGPVPAPASRPVAPVVDNSPTMPTVPPDTPSSAPAPRVDIQALLAPPQAAGELGRLGAYRVLSVLGTGGMGMVFQAEDTKLNRSVALKIMQPGLAASGENRQRFLQEGRAAAAVEHDHIITIYQVDEERGLPYLAMQLLRGESLEARLARQPGPQPLAFTLRTGREIAAGLEAAHEQGLIHRDIKPSNIWLESRGGESGARSQSGVGASSPRVKILDFGLARVLHHGSQLTQSGVVLGTPGYLAPEQVGGQQTDTACDRFSLGVILYRMCTGRLPFEGTDTLSLLAALATGVARPLREANPNVPPALADLVMRMLERDPAARPSDREVIETLAALETNPALPVPVSPAPLPRASAVLPASDRTAMLPAPRPVTASSSRGLWIAVAAGGSLLVLVLICGVGAGALAWWKTSPSAKVTSVNDPGPPKPKVEPKPEEDALAFAKDSVQKKRFTRTQIVGFPFHQQFDDMPPEGGLLIGFEVGMGKFIQNDVIQSLRPIFLTEKGEVLGALHGKQAERVVVVKAKPGYAVGGVSIQTGLLIDGLRLTYMRIGKDRLQTEQSYQSDWLGGGRNGHTIAGTGALVIGICGKQDADKCDALGLVITYLQIN